MTVIERIKQAVDNYDCEKDNLDKIIALAYMIGKEKATKEVSDAYSKLLAEQRERAEKCRYHKMAAEIIGDKEHLYFGDYDGGMRYTFGSDETEV